MKQDTLMNIYRLYVDALKRGSVDEAEAFATAYNSLLMALGGPIANPLEAYLAMGGA